MSSSSLLSGCTFYIPIGSSMKKKVKQVQTTVSKFGGSWASAFSTTVTHVLVADEEFSNKNVLVEKSLQKGIPVITEAWITHTIKANGNPVNPPPSTIILPAFQSKELTKAPTSKFPTPVLSMILPQSGPTFGNFKVAVFGQNFIDGPLFKVRIGHLDAIDYEFHSSTAVVASIPSTETPFAPGQTLTGVSNDGGKTWGQPLVFSIYDPALTSAPLPPPALFSHYSSLTGSSQLLLEASQATHEISNPQPIVAGASTTDAIPRAKTLHKVLEREVRVFISSPFTDMQQERDTLVKKTIPKLRKLCMERDVAFSYVDLRWGVTAAQSETATALLLCLREIDTCNAFIGFYGERYGWCISPEREPQQNELLRRSIHNAAKEYPWVNDMTNLSMSEIEMRMVLDRKYQHGNKSSWFYLRDPYYVEEVPEKERHLFRSESDKAHQQLEAFKRYISTHSSPRNYARPSDVSDVVYEDIRSYIDVEYPPEARLSPLERERFRHDVYARSFTFCYLPNEVYFNQLDRHVSNISQKPLVVVGEAGIGKSALVANWALRHREHAPEDIVIHHYIGCSPHSSNAGELLSRVLLELKEKLEFHDDKIYASTDPTYDGSSKGMFGSSNTIASTATDGMGLNVKRVIKEFLNSIKTIVSKYNYNKRRIVLVIDGLNKIDARENAQDLIWLPQSFPKSVRVILSCSPCFVLDVLKQRKGTEFMELQSMGEADRKAFIRTYLTHRSKRLSEKQEFQIAQAPQTSHPLYLKTLLDDLSEFGKFEQLDGKIALNLQASNTSSLYDIVLKRLEEEHDRKASTSKPTLAASAMPSKAAVAVTSSFLTLIYGARRGLLLQSELDQLLSVRRGIPEESWMDFFVVADETLLADCSGLLRFANEDVRKAVVARYLKTDAQKEAIHKELAEFFSTIPDLTERKVEELPHQLAESKQYEPLKNCLCDLAMFDRLYTSDSHKFDLLRYWRLLEGQKYDVVECYKTIVARGLFPSGIIVGDLIYHLGRFMLDMDKNAGAEFMFQKAEAYYHQASQMINVAKVSTSLGELYFTQMRYEDCEKMLLKSISIFEKEKGPASKDLIHPLDRLGVLYTAQHKFDNSKETLERALHLSESITGSESLETANVIYDLACNYLTSGGGKEAIDKAEQFLLRALQGKESLLGPWDIEVSHVLLRLGAMYMEQDQFGDAEACLTRSLTIREAKLGKDHSRVAQCLRHLVTCYEMQELYSKALEAGMRALEITKKIYGDHHIQTSGVLLRIGTVYLTEGNSGSTSIARKYINEALDIRKKLYKPDHRAIQECVKILDSMNPTPSVSPIPVGIPPPPPLNILKPIALISLAPEQTKKLQLDAKGVPVGPPPPPPQMTTTKQVKAHVSNEDDDSGYLDQLQQFKQSQYLNKARTEDRSDAQHLARVMMGTNERKLQFKKKLK